MVSPSEEQPAAGNSQQPKGPQDTPPTACGQDESQSQAGNESTHEQLVAELTAALEAAKNAELRALAELDNFRKRMRREQEETLRFANWHLLADLLEIVDNLSRAVHAADQPGADLASLRDGVKLVLQQLQGVLTKYHCEKIPAQGRPFDPDMHSAVGQVATAELPPGTVAHVTREGYRLHDRILRPAEVLVSVEPPSPSPSMSPS